MSYSELAQKFMPAYSGNYTAGRQAAVSEITFHHTGDVITLDRLGNLWKTKGRNGSSHYGVKDDEVYCYISEGDTAWTNSNWRSNCRAITIETVNSAEGGNWPVSDASIDTLIKLVADIARRHNLGKLKVGENLTYHSMYTATVCPGPYLRSKLQYIADMANALNEEWLVTDKLLEVISSRCEFFNSADVYDVVGKLPQGMVYQVIALSKEKIGGFSWAKIAMVDGEYYVALLSDRCVLTAPKQECENCFELEAEISRLKENIEQLEQVNTELVAELTDRKVAVAQMKEENRKLNEILTDIENLVQEVTK